MIEQPTQTQNLFNVNLIITHKNEQPCLMLRRETTDTEIIKTIISSAVHGKPIIILPTFTNITQSLNTLIQKGIIYSKTKTNTKGEVTKEYFYNI